MSVTLKDIAREVGKSVTTVSRALNGYDDVSPSTREEILRVAEEMGYSPNIMAQRLQKQRSDTIGLILPTFGPRFSDPFFSEFLVGIGNRANQQGYDILLSTFPPGDEEIAAYRKRLSTNRVDGFIIVRTRREDPRVRFLSERGFPFVAFGRTEQDIDFPFVDEDGEQGMLLVTRHLIGLGHRRIAFIAAPSDLNFARLRFRGFRRALEEAGIPLDQDMVVKGDLTQGGGREAAGRILSVPDRPSAIVACNDLMALGAIGAAEERGFEVGHDLAVTGFDDIPPAEFSHVPLTTVRQPIYQIGKTLCDMLVTLIKGEELQERHIILEPSLVIRRSSCPPAG